MESNRHISRRQLLRIATLGTLVAGAIYLAEKDSKEFGKSSSPIPIDEVINNPDNFQNITFKTSGYLEYINTHTEEGYSLSYYNAYSNPEHTGNHIPAILPWQGSAPKELFMALEDQGKIVFLANLKEVSEHAPQMGVYQMLITELTEIQ